jgi:transposase-like protein
MTRPYSNDLRERVVGAVERGEMSCRQAAAHYDVGISTATRWVRRRRRTGSVSPAKIGGYRPKKLIGAVPRPAVARAETKRRGRRQGSETRRLFCMTGRKDCLAIDRHRTQSDGRREDTKASLDFRSGDVGDDPLRHAAVLAIALGLEDQRAVRRVA